MKKTILTLFACAAVAAFAPLASVAAETPTPVQQEKKADKEQPFHGKVTAMDAAAKTLTVGEKVVVVSDTTKLTKTGKAITLAEIQVGDEVHGMGTAAADGKINASAVKVGPEEKKKS